MYKKNYKSLYFYFIFIFLILGNFYWYPFIDSSITLKYSKYFLLATSFTFFILSNSHYPIKIKKSSIIVNSFFIIWIFFALYYYTFFDVVDVIIHSSLFFIFFLMGKAYLPNRSYSKTATAFIIFSLAIMIFSFFVDLDFFKKSVEIESTNIILNLNLSSIGFGQSRTTWGVGITFIALFLAWYFNELKYTWVANTILILSFLSVLVSGSRGALLYFLIYFLLILIFSSKSIKSYILYFFILISLSFAVINIFGFDSLDRGSSDITSGRAEGYKYLSYLFDNKKIFFGYEPYGGYTLDSFRDGYSKIHNAFINYLLSYGLINFLFLNTVLIMTLLKCLRNFNPSLAPLYYLVFCGLVSTALEPDTIFSYGHHTLIFWFILGFLYSNSNKGQTRVIT